MRGFRDLRLAGRAIRAAPGFAAVVVLVLALGLGASTAIFSVVDATVLRELPFDRADRLVAVGDLTAVATGASDGFETPQDFLDWRDRQTVFADVAASGYAGLSLKPDGPAPPEILAGLSVTARFFEVLHVTPLLGRTFTTDNERAEQSGVALISYALWQRRYGGRSDVIGARLPGQQRDFEIIGVLPPAVSYPVGVTDATDVYLPVVFGAADRQRATSYARVLQVIGRLRDGVPLGVARAQIVAITSTLAAETPRWFEGRHVTVEPLHATLVAGARTWMMMLLGAVVCVLLIAAINVANLLLARATTRDHELRLRAALGGSTWDLARLLLTESLVLAVAGATLGVLGAYGAVDALRAALPPDVPGLANIAINARVLLVAASAAVAVGFGCGLVPALQAARPASGRLLGDATRTQTPSAGRQRVRAVLVVLEVAGAVVLLVGAGLFLTSFARVTSVDLGLDYRNVLTLQVRPLERANSPAEIALMSDRHRAAFDAILERVRGLPGVDDAALVSQGLPLRGDLTTGRVGVRGRTIPASEDVEINPVSPGYLHLLRIPILEGRGFTEADRAGSPDVIVLNAMAARAYFPGVDPVGQQMDLNDRPVTVVGIVGDIRPDGPESPARRQAYRPFAQSSIGGATVLVRTAASAAALGPALEQAVWSQFPNVPLFGVVPLEQFLRTMLAPRRLNMLLLTLFGLLGLAIAAVGIYAVTSFVVAQRTREIGIRLALGAPPSVVLAAVVGGAFRPVAVGLAVGTAGAWLVSVALQRFLFAVSAHGLTTYVGAAGVLAAAGLLAAVVPALRASRVDPLIALRPD